MNKFDFYGLLCKITLHKFKYKYCLKCHPLRAFDIIRAMIPVIAIVGMSGFIALAVQDKRHLNKGIPKKKNKRKK
jgi:hypothetical protein